MRRPALTGDTNRARTEDNLRGQDHPTPTCQSDTDAPEIRQAMEMGFKRRRAIQLVKFWQAQARFEASFVDWLTYSDPTGELATNNVLWNHARAVA